MPTLTANPEVPRGAAPTIEIAGRPPSKEKGKEKEKIADKMKAMRDRVAGRISKLLNRDKASGQEGLQELAKGELSQEKSKSRLSQAWRGAKSRVSAFRESIKSTPAEQQQKETARAQKKKDRENRRQEGLERWNQFKTDSKEKWGKRKEAFDEKKDQLKDKLSEKAISTAFNVAKEADKRYKKHLENKDRRQKRREFRREGKEADAVFNTLNTGEVDSAKLKKPESWKHSTEKAHKFMGKRQLTTEAKAWATSKENRDDVKARYDAILDRAKADGKILSRRGEFKAMADAIHQSRLQAGDELMLDIMIKQRSGDFKQAVEDERARKMLESGKKLTAREKRDVGKELLTKAVKGEPYTAEDIAKAQADAYKANSSEAPTQTPREKFNATLQDLDDKLAAGEIDQAEHSKRYAEAHSEWKTAEAAASSTPEATAEAEPADKTAEAPAAPKTPEQILESYGLDINKPEVRKLITDMVNLINSTTEGGTTEAKAKQGSIIAQALQAVLAILLAAGAGGLKGVGEMAEKGSK